MTDRLQAMQRLLSNEIQQAGGCLPFADFMQIALYHPQVGYYTTSPTIFGSEGDFITAPLVSSCFSRCIAKACQNVLSSCGGGDVLEFGAGSGEMAATIASYLSQAQALQRYFIVEISPNLAARQRQYIAENHPDILAKVTWVDSVPKNFSGVIIANELLDAMPVECFQWRDKRLAKLGVACDQQQFVWQEMPASNEEYQIIASYHQQYCREVSDYRFELSKAIPKWLHSITQQVEQATLLLIDYGFSRQEYYHPDRSMGTLMCHQRHHTHPDPLQQPGNQDITAHVDFTLVAESAEASGWAVREYTTQAYFLLAMGLMEMSDLESQTDLDAIKTLTMPHEMGELFKVMILEKNMSVDHHLGQWPSFLNRL